MDWREMRARLIASQGFEKEAPASSGNGGFIYESPLIEQGTILLGGTKMEFGFALRQVTENKRNTHTTRVVAWEAGAANIDLV